MQGEIKVFEMNDCDWMAARSLEEAKKAYVGEFSGEEDELADARELTDEDMNRLQLRDDDKPVVSFAQALAGMIAEGREFPTFFASTEY